MSAATQHGAQPYYFVPAPSRHPVMAGVRPVPRDLRRRPVDQRRGVGRLGRARRLRRSGPSCCSSGSATRSRESEGGLYSERIDVSFRWSMSWFIFSEVMFFGAFFGALYWARAAHAAGARQPRERRAVARLQGGLAELGRRLHRLAGRHRRAVRDDGPVADPDHQHGAAADLGRDADDRPPRADRRQARARRSSGCGSPCCSGVTFLGFQAYEYMHAYQRPEPEAQLGHLRLDLLHADRLPRLPRVRRHADAAVHHAAADEGPLHAASATSASKARPGTGTSSTSSGSACTSSSTGC